MRHPTKANNQTARGHVFLWDIRGQWISLVEGNQGHSHFCVVALSPCTHEMAPTEYLQPMNPHQYQEIDMEYLKLLLSQAERMEQLLSMQEDSRIANKLQGSLPEKHSHPQGFSPNKDFEPLSHQSPPSPPLESQRRTGNDLPMNISEEHHHLQKENRRDSMLSDVTDIETCDIICQEAISALEQNEREKQQLLVEMQEQRKKYINERNQLQTEMERLKSERENAEKIQEKYKMEAESLKEKLQLVSQELEEKKLPSYEQLHKELEKMTELYASQNEALQKLREEKVKLLEELEEKEASKIDLRKKLSSVETDLQILEKSKARVDSEYEKLQKQLSELEEERRKLVQETTSNQEVDSLRRKLRTQANEKLELIQQLESIREEYKELKSSIVEEYEQMKSQYAQLESQQKETLKQLDNLKDQYTALLKENENLHKRNEELENKCKSLEEQLHELESKEQNRNTENDENHSTKIREAKKKILKSNSEAMERERQIFIADVLALKKKREELVAQLQKVASSGLNKETGNGTSAFQTMYYCMEDIQPRSNILKNTSEPSKVWLQKVQQQMSQTMRGNAIRTNLHRALVHTFRHGKRNSPALESIENQEMDTQL